MFEQFKSMFDDLLKERQKALNEKIDKFNDSFAREISWRPKTSLLCNFTNRALIKREDDYTYTLSVWGLLFSLAFLVTGFVLIIKFAQPVLPLKYYFYLISNNHTMLAILLFSLVFVLMGIAFLVYFAYPAVFKHKEQTIYLGYFFFGRKVLSYDSIYSLQICGGSAGNISHNGVVRSHNKSKFVSTYELNLVLPNKNRINLAVHSNLGKIRESGIKLSKEIKKPLWDAVDNS
jgi:hypothetical protein